MTATAGKYRSRRVFGIAIVLLAITCGIFPNALPGILATCYPGVVFRNENGKRVIFLTIDDAPTESTGAILAVLAKHQVQATFFVISGRVRSENDLRAIVDAGHALGHHMRSTKRCSQLGWEEFKEDFDFTDSQIKRIYPATLFRPPSDFGTERQLTYVKEHGYTPILGTVFPLDHWIEQPWLLAFLSRWLAIPGGILIMHDGASRAPRTAAVLDEIVPKLRQDGYTFELLPALAKQPSTTETH